MENLITYKDAGVDLEAAQSIVDDIAVLRQRTEQRHRMLDRFGGFAAAYDLSVYREPVLMTTCDGIGTKIIPLLEHDMLEAAGVDLVAMNVNDVLTTGARPILFLDYVGVGRIERSRIKRLIQGMSDALTACDCVLAGGETAEMPDIVGPDQLELAGFCVGAMEKADRLPADTIQDGDVVMGVPSDGFHANGWSLIRKVLERGNDSFSEAEVQSLLTPTRIYYPEVVKLQAAGIAVKAMAHITGGGLAENFARVLNGHGAQLRIPTWADPVIRRVLAHVPPEDALRAFNMGWGWVMVLDAEAATRALDVLSDARAIGEVGGTSVHVEMES